MPSKAFVPRAERRKLILRAVFDDGRRHIEGTVRDLSTTGLYVEGDIGIPVGSVVAVAILSGGFDGERLYSEVARIDPTGFALHFDGLDPGRRQRMRALRDGVPMEKAGLLAKNVEPLKKRPPPNAPVLLLTGGEDAVGEPTGNFALPMEVPMAEPPVQPFARVAPPPIPVIDIDDPSIEAQLVELGLRNNALADENARLRAELERLRTEVALKGAMEEELADALARLESIEKSLRGR